MSNPCEDCPAKNKRLEGFYKCYAPCVYARQWYENKANKGRKRTMTNYEKYAGTPERFAELVIQLDCEGGAGEELTRQFCRGGCHREDDDADCTDENLKKCIMTWLRKDAEEAKHHLELLACYGCRYKDDCEGPFEHGRPMCDEQHVDAVEFAKRLNEDLEEAP